MTEDFADDEYSFLDWGVRVYPVPPQEPDMTRIIRRAEAKRAGLKLWAEVQRELVKRA